MVRELAFDQARAAKPENDGRARMIVTQQDLEKFENGRTWRKLSAKVRNDNPICQFIDPDTKEQCRYPSTVVHHLTDPRDCNELALAVSNLVACCAPITIRAGIVATMAEQTTHQPGTLRAWVSPRCYSWRDVHGSSRP